MTIFVYYIGGSLDMTKRALKDHRDSPPRELIALAPIHLPDIRSTPSGAEVIARKEVYRLLGQTRRQDTFIYEYEEPR